MKKEVTSGAGQDRVSFPMSYSDTLTNERSISMLRVWSGRLLALGLVLSMALFMWRSYEGTGLFLNLGTDYGLYLAQATVMGGNDPTRIYDQSSINVVYRQLLDDYAHDPAYDSAFPGVWASHVPYPPIFAWAMQPLTWVAPPVSFLLWSAVNILLVLWIGWRVASHCRGADKPTIMLLLLGSYPVALNFQVGQIQLLLAWALTECYLALRGGKDFRAGLWLGCLLLKPHYGLLLGPLLLWKCRWSAVAGVAVTASVIAGGSLLAGGLSTLLAYPQAFSGMVQFRGDYPTPMVNWRSLVLDFYSTIYWRSGILLTIFLGVVTTLCVAWIWRGPWKASAADFPAKMLLTMTATLMVNYHSHPYGAAILVMPLLSTIYAGGMDRLGQAIAAVGAIVPAIIFTADYSGPISSWEWGLHLEFASQILKATVFALYAHTFISLTRTASVRKVVVDSWGARHAIRFLRQRHVPANHVVTPSPDERRHPMAS